MSERRTSRAEGRSAGFGDISHLQSYMDRVTYCSFHSVWGPDVGWLDGVGQNKPMCKEDSRWIQTCYLDSKYKR